MVQSAKSKVKQKNLQFINFYTIITVQMKEGDNMPYFKDIDYSYYGDREDPEVNVRYFMNHIIMIIDSTKKEEELLHYDLR